MNLYYEDLVSANHLLGRMGPYSRPCSVHPQPNIL